MARIDFYVLSESGEQARQLFACRLAEKAYRLENTVHIAAPSRGDAERVDDLLWTFRDGSFVPHHLIGAADIESPVTIGAGAVSPASADLLINLCDELPPDPTSFARIAEVVSDDDDCRQRSRQRFSAYRDAGHDIETHRL